MSWKIRCFFNVNKTRHHPSSTFRRIDESKETQTCVSAVDNSKHTREGVYSFSMTRRTCEPRGLLRVARTRTHAARPQHRETAARNRVRRRGEMTARSVCEDTILPLPPTYPTTACGLVYSLWLETLERKYYTCTYWQKLTARTAIKQLILLSYFWPEYYYQNRSSSRIETNGSSGIARVTITGIKPSRLKKRFGTWPPNGIEYILLVYRYLLL